MVCAALVATTTVFAAPVANDTTTIDAKIENNNGSDGEHYSYGTREVIVNDHEVRVIKHGYGSDSDESYKFINYVGSDKFHPHLSSIDLGASRYSSKPFSAAIDDSVSYLDLSRGFHFSMGFVETSVPIVKDRLGIGIAIGLKHDCYSFSTKNLKLDKDGNGHLTHYTDTSKDYAKSKLRNTYFMIPVVLEYQPMGYNGLVFQAGVEGNLRMWSKTKMKTSSGEKNRTHSNFYQNLFSYNLVAKVGVDCVGAFVRASMTPMIQEGKGPELYQLSAGVSLTF